MITIIKKQCSQAVLLATLVAGGNVVQAETTECTEIPSIPYTINTQGVYCLKHSLSANLAIGAAIMVVVNNVTIDLNGFKLGNLAAGAGTQAEGISVINRSNVTVRNGIIRGYLKGIFLAGRTGGNHVVENMRLDKNTVTGIEVYFSPNVTLRNNSIAKTGGSTEFGAADGIVVSAPGIKIIDNDIINVFSATDSARGIFVNSNNAQILNNSVSQLTAPPASYERHIHYWGQGAVLDGNRLIEENKDGFDGIVVSPGSLALCSNTKAVGFTNATTVQCHDGGGNVAIH